MSGVELLPNSLVSEENAFRLCHLAVGS